MAVTLNTITTTNFSGVRIKEIDFASRFEATWEALREIMGIMRPIAKTAGTKLVASNATVTLASGIVLEGDEVPLSSASVTPVEFGDIQLKKYRKRVTAEAVDKYGPEVAVQKTDDAFLNELTGGIMDDFYTFLQSGSLDGGTEATFQMAVAMAVTRVKDKFKTLHLNYSNIVVFVNTLDVGKYLGTAPITMQTRNGIEYFKDFLGANTVIVSSEIPEGTVIAVPADNIVLYYIDPTSHLSALGLEYTTTNSPTRLIGVAKTANYERVSGETHVIHGLHLFAEYLDGICVTTIGTDNEGGTGGDVGEDA